MAAGGNTPTVVTVSDHYSEDASYYKKKAEEAPVENNEVKSEE